MINDEKKMQENVQTWRGQRYRGAHIVWGANRNPYTASSNPSLRMTLNDLEQRFQGHPFWKHTNKWRTVAKWSEIPVMYRE